MEKAKIYCSHVATDGGEQCCGSGVIVGYAWANVG